MVESDACLKHSGICAKITGLEEDVKSLWSKWDNMQKLLIGTLTSTMLSLIGVVFLLIQS